MRAAGPHSEEMDPELRTVMLGGREEEAAPASGMFLVTQPHLCDCLINIVVGADRVHCAGAPVVNRCFCPNPGG